MEENYDNIELFNSLTHFDNGLADSKLFDKFLKQFHLYKLFREFVINIDIKERKIKINKSSIEKGIVFFNLEFKNKKDCKKFNDEITGKELFYKDKSYKINFTVSDKNLIISFFVD